MRVRGLISITALTTPLRGNMNKIDMKTLERAIKATADSMVQQNIRLYLQMLKERKFKRLLQEDMPAVVAEERNIIIGELRVIQKLLDILEPKTTFIMSSTFDNRDVL